MEERESSTSSSVDFYGSEKQPETEPPRVAGAAKRKAEDVESTDDKKRKLDSSSLSTCKPKPCAGLSPAIWQHVFLFCSLYDLGRLLQVNQSFRSYLTDVSNVSYLDPISGSLRLLKSDSVWASARNALPVKPPKPLPGFSELRMWQLAWSKRCQFCRKENASVPGDKIWQKGPGEDGVRTIWPFGIISCGPCVLKQCQTVSGSQTRIQPSLINAGFESPLLICFRCSTRFALYLPHQRWQLHSCIHSTSCHYTCRSRNWQILLQKARARHYKGTGSGA
jgi:hypothetical protein